MPVLLTNKLAGVELRGYNFRNMDFSNADFQGADLSGSTFYGSDLSKAKLNRVIAKGTIFTDVDLTDACLNSSCLIGANFSGANLTRANLEGADLCVANLSSVRFGYTRMHGAKIWDTSFTNIDLSRVDWDEVEFQGPCDIGIGSLEITAREISRSNRSIPSIEYFLRGCGASEESIDYFRCRIKNPIQMQSAFISYSHVDSEFALKLYEYLKKNGIRCWLDAHDLKPGKRILDGINQAIRFHERLILCCSRTSLESWWVKDEIRKAQEKEKSQCADVIIPILLDHYLLEGWEDGLATDLRSRLGVNFTGWESDGLIFDIGIKRLLDALKAP